MSGEGGGDRPIADYALLSDCHSTALVSSAGSVDWACLRRFDRGSTFARLLDHERGGHYSITPTEPVHEVSRRYVPGTMVLETTRTTSSAELRCLDAFAMRQGGRDSPRAELLRRVECVHGATTLDVELVARFDYGAVTPWLHAVDPARASAIGGDDAIVVAASHPLTLDYDGGAMRARVELSAGEHLDLSLVAQPAHMIDPSAADVSTVSARLEETLSWWQRWSKSTTASGPHAELLARAALVLKALCCAPTGAIIAAPTTSLPEIVGGSANWDYRYCWLRDATLALEALAELGHLDVAHGFRRFLIRSAAGHGSEIQIMYGSYGERRLGETEVELSGWRGSRPVRVGNAAVDQLQLDVYGHVLDAVHVWHRRHHDIDADEWRFLASVVDEAARRWNEPDAGIWEQRADPEHFVHSKAMAWVALDRGLRLADEEGMPAPHREQWAEARDAVRWAVDEHGVDPEGGHFVTSFGSRTVDAGLLKLATCGFVDPLDPRMVATVRAIEERLLVNGFVRRSEEQHPDSTVAADDEGAFLLCSCWLVEVLALQGRTKDAEVLLDRVVAVANDVGLFAEEYDPASDQLLGNFPQAFTHLGVVTAARRLREA